MTERMGGHFRHAVSVTRPSRTAVFMLGFLVIVAVVGFWLFQSIRTVFTANPWLNGLILLVLLVGIGYTFWQVSRLNRCVDWIEAFIAERPGLETIEPPRLVASMAGMLRDRESRRSLSASTVRAILDSIATRLDEARDIARYAANLLIFLGLLGTFWGLSITVPAIVATVQDLAPGANETGASTFSRLIDNLGDQLEGLGTAFASSLLGLAGSLIVGFLEIMAGHAQNRFYRELEEALSQITHVARGESGPEHISGSVARTAEAMEDLTALMVEDYERAAQTHSLMEHTAAQLAAVTEHYETGKSATMHLSGSQDALRLALLEATERNKGVIGGMDEATRARIQNIDNHMLRLVEELTAGRAESTAQLRNEIQHLGRVIEAAARGELGG